MQTYRYRDNEKYAGALKKDKHVLAYDRDNEWKLAKILEVRYFVPYDEDAKFYIQEEPREQENGQVGQQNTGSETTAGVAESGAAANEEMKAVENNTTNAEDAAAENGQQDRDMRESPEDDANGVAENRAKQPVEYYVNYLDQERPMDRWVVESMVRINDKLVEKLLEDFHNREAEKKKNREQQTFLQHDEHAGMSEEEIRNFMNATRLKTIEFLQFGDITMEAWYYSALPPEFHGRVLYMCPFCLFFFTKKCELEAHSETCTVRCPPGDEIYRDETLSMFEFDARQ